MKKQSNKDPEVIELSKAQYEELCTRLESGELTAEDRATLAKVLKSVRWLFQQLEAGRLGLGRLKRILFGGEKTEKRTDLFPEDEEQKAVDLRLQEDKDNTTSDPKKGHGRNPASAYGGADKVHCPHKTLKAGDLCPECKKGKLHDSIEPGVFVRFKGNPPISATIYETEKLRCAVCGKIYEAPLPEGVPPVRWDETAHTMAAICRYGYGFPHFRMERLQTDLGIPVPDSVLFNLSETVADCGLWIYRELVKSAANGTLIHSDDTMARILSLMQENKRRNPEKERVGIFTTAVISKVEEREIALFFTGRNHTGENITELLSRRTPGLSPPLLMTDGASRNIPGELEVILLNCLTHGRRAFVDVKEGFPDEVRHVIDCLAEIYHFDAIAKETAMTPNERLRFHQENSGPWIEKLKAWCLEQITHKKVEPNSGLGKAIKYMQKRWPQLTQFLRIEGAPLSNDTCEQLIKRYVLHRKNSLFYFNQHGAVIGDMLMTLIHTAVRAKKNPFDYLTQIQRNRKDAKENPVLWLPWNYELRVAALAAPNLNTPN